MIGLMIGLTVKKTTNITVGIVMPEQFQVLSSLPESLPMK